MTTLLNIYNLYTGSANLRNRTFAAVLVLANYILSEAPSTENHAARLVWAKAALISPNTAVSEMMPALVTNGTIANAGESATDNDIEWVVGNRVSEIAAAASG